MNHNDVCTQFVTVLATSWGQPWLKARLTNPATLHRGQWGQPWLKARLTNPATHRVPTLVVKPGKSLEFAKCIPGPGIGLELSF